VTPEEREVLAATVFASTARDYWARVADEADLERVYVGMEDEADRTQKRLEGDVWARAVGRACAVDLSAEAGLWELLLHSPDVAVRAKAADLIVLKFQAAREAA
jgi:hypothetical protein